MAITPEERELLKAEIMNEMTNAMTQRTSVNTSQTPYMTTGDLQENFAASTQSEMKPYNGTITNKMITIPKGNRTFTTEPDINCEGFALTGYNLMNPRQDNSGIIHFKMNDDGSMTIDFPKELEYAANISVVLRS